MKPGARYLGNDTCEFQVWGPLLQKVEVRLISPVEKIRPLRRDDRGYWSAVIEGVPPGTDYCFILEQKMERPDPASAFQPKGVHGPSRVVDHGAFAWRDGDWKGVPLEKMVLYEVHVGAFSEEGTFAGVAARLDELLDLGVNALSLMPVAQFPGERNWGYDGVYPYAVQHSYGGPAAFKELVDVCHRRGIAVILDVVYNHLGPEGNYLADFGPYFTDRFRTPWGKALNFDGAYSDPVRAFFIENALYWFDCYHVDGLRLDAVHAICDLGAKHFLEELGEAVADYGRTKGRKYLLIPESDLNDVRLIKPRASGGYGMDAQWCDDFHHSLHALLTGENSGYYADFGKIEHLVKAYREGFVYSWDYSVYRKKRHGSSSLACPARQFVVFSQNHDQVGNRRLGERLSRLVSFEALKVAAAAVILSPFVPLLFMGEEYGEENPFLYFIHHSDPPLVEAVRQGRKKEFESFGHREEFPDPQSPLTFLRSKLSREKSKKGKHGVLRDFYRRLITLRRNVPALADLSKENLALFPVQDGKALAVYRRHGNSRAVSLMNFDVCAAEISLQDFPPGRWRKLIDSKEESWLGPGSPLPEVMKSEKSILLPPLGIALYQIEVRT